MALRRTFIGLLGAVAAARLVELGWSRAHLRRLRRRGGKIMHEPLFPIMAALHTATLIAAPIEASLRRRPPSRALARTALAAFALASALRVWTLWTLGEAWSVRVVRFPKGARPIVAGGPYRFVRHPNYLAVIVELAALPLAGGAVWTALMASLADAALLARRIPLEERELFADPRYRAAMGEVPRLWPRLRPRR